MQKPSLTVIWLMKRIFVKVTYVTPCYINLIPISSAYSYPVWSCKCFVTKTWLYYNPMSLAYLLFFSHIQKINFLWNYDTTVCKYLMHDMHSLFHFVGKYFKHQINRIQNVLQSVMVKKGVYLCLLHLQMEICNFCNIRYRFI